MRQYSNLKSAPQSQRSHRLYIPSKLVGLFGESDLAIFFLVFSWQRRKIQDTIQIYTSNYIIRMTHMTVSQLELSLFWGYTKGTSLFGKVP